MLIILENIYLLNKMNYPRIFFGFMILLSVLIIYYFNSNLKYIGALFCFCLGSYILLKNMEKDNTHKFNSEIIKKGHIY